MKKIFTKRKKPLKKWHTDKRITAVLCLVILVLVVSIYVASNYKTPEEKAEIETKTKCVNIATSEISQYIAGAKCETDSDLWLTIPGNDGETIINTYVSVPNKNAKQFATVIVTATGDGQYTTHYINVGDTVYKDDGEIE